jgi:hypothetical protein
MRVLLDLWHSYLDSAWQVLSHQNVGDGWADILVVAYALSSPGSY